MGRVTGTFYAYDDVKLAKSHVFICKTEKANAKIAEKAEEEEKKKACQRGRKRSRGFLAKDDEKPKEKDFTIQDLKKKKTQL